MLRNASAVLIVLLVANGCTSAFPPADALEEPTCADHWWSPTDDLRVVLEVEYVGLTVGAYEWSNSSGDACEGVSDLDACIDELNALSSSRGLVVRTGDGLMRWDVDDLVPRLAPIDSLDEAVVIAVLSGYDPPECDGRTGGRAVAGGWELVLTRDVECGDFHGSVREVRIYRHLVQVSEDGSVTELDREESRRTECEDHCETTCG